MGAEISLDQPKPDIDVKFQRLRDGTIKALIKTPRAEEVVDLGYPETASRKIFRYNIQARLEQAVVGGIGLAVVGDGSVHFWKGITNNNWRETIIGVGEIFAGWFTGSRFWDDATANIKRMRVIKEKFNQKS